MGVRGREDGGLGGGGMGCWGLLRCLRPQGAGAWRAGALPNGRSDIGKDGRIFSPVLYKTSSHSEPQRVMVGISSRYDQAGSAYFSLPSRSFVILLPALCTINLQTNRLGDM